MGPAEGGTEGGASQHWGVREGGAAAEGLPLNVGVNGRQVSLQKAGASNRARGWWAW